MDAFCKVLVVDDEMLVRQGIKHLFDWESEGFTIIGEASNGVEALEQIEQLEPHILLMDILMPVMDGEELARVVKNKYPDVKIIVLSSFSEFDYVRSTFQSGATDYILKPKLEAAQLLSILKKIANSIPVLHSMDSEDLKERSINSLLDKFITGYSTDEGIDVLEPMFPYSSYMLFVAELTVTRKSIPLEDIQIMLISKIRELVNSSSEPVSYRALYPEGSRIRILFNGMPSLIEWLSTEIQHGLQDLPQDQWPFVAALSHGFEDLSELHNVYTLQISGLLEKRFFIPDRRLFVASTLQKEEDGSQPKSFDHQTFTEEINSHQFGASFERLRSYLTSMPGRTDVNLYEFKSFLGHSIFNIIMALLRFHYEAAKLDTKKYEYFRSIHESSMIDETIVQVERFLQEAEACMMERSRSVSGQSVQKMLSYIQEHYAEALSLTGIAQYFHFNPSYLSNYFATHNKEGFSEYLNRVRIEKACELLGLGNMSISDISSQVGYSDHSYFTKVFRKLTGISPRQYRKQVTEGRRI